MVDEIARTRSCHIVTIEDPIEFIFKDRRSIVTQREVSLDTHNFPQALKYALRQDPDVILVGEMRDEETILMALNAAETGHLVLSSLHTVDARETVNRILGSVEGSRQSSVRAQLSSVLIAVISQRLIRRDEGGDRLLATEIMVSNQRIRDLISDPSRTGDLHRAIEESESDGMQTFDQSLLRLVQLGTITADEALSYCSNARDFSLRLSGVVAGGGQLSSKPTAGGGNSPAATGSKSGIFWSQKPLSLSDIQIERTPAPAKSSDEVTSETSPVEPAKKPGLLSKFRR
jgi:twitching motility protein PilT